MNIIITITTCVTINNITLTINNTITIIQMFLGVGD